MEVEAILCNGCAHLDVCKYEPGDKRLGEKTKELVNENDSVEPFRIRIECKRYKNGNVPNLRGVE